MAMKILFVCHGNICRSPMAEMIFRHLARQQGRRDVEADSCAVSREEIGNPVDSRARAELARHGIPCEAHRARQMVVADYAAYDLIIGMDRWNMSAMQRIAGGDPDNKLRLLMDFTERPGDVSDPWYSDRFDTAYEDIREGCEGLLRAIK